MPLFQVRNRRARIILGEVRVSDVAEVVEAIAEHTGSSIEELVASLGDTREDAEAALEIVELPDPDAPTQQRDQRPRKTLDHLPRRWAS